MNKVVKEQLDRYDKFYNDLSKLCNLDEKVKSKIYDLISKYELDLINNFELRNKIYKEVDLDFLRQDIVCYLEENGLDRYANITKDDWKNLDFYELEDILDDIADKRDEYRMNDMPINEVLDTYQKFEVEEEVDNIKNNIKDVNNKYDFNKNNINEGNSNER